MFAHKRYSRKKIKKKNCTVSKAANGDRKKKSRYVQELPRKDGNCMNLLKDKIKTWKISVSLFSIHFMYELEEMCPN